MPTKIKQSMPLGRQAEAQRIPKLRFAGFCGEWEEKRLGEMFPEIKSGKDKPETEGKYFVYGSTGVIGNIQHFTYEGAYILIARVGANAGKINRVKGKFGVTDNTLILENRNNADVDFFYNFLESKKLNRLVFGSGQPLVTSGQLKKLKIIIPQIKKEQQKIAEFLESVDGWIENLRMQKEDLEDYKKGMMQKIFPFQGGQVPEVRFKDDDGNDFGEWEEKRLEEVCEKESSGISANSLDDNYGEYKIYGANGKLKKVDFYQQNKSYISIVKDGAGVGRILICEPKTSVLGTLDIIKPKEHVNLYFLYSLLARIKFKKYTIGSTIPHIYFKDYKKEKIQIPSFPEQQKTADFLTSIDNLINSKQQQITQAEQWKKGLMQNLFI